MRILIFCDLSNTAIARALRLASAMTRQRGTWPPTTYILILFAMVTAKVLIVDLGDAQVSCGIIIRHINWGLLNKVV